LVASPFAGALKTLHVQRGEQVREGYPLFELDPLPEKSARDEAERRLVQAKATLEDVKKGLRPPEIEAIEAQLKQARAAEALSEKEYERLDKLGHPTISADELDRARSQRDQDRQRVLMLQANLTTGKLGSRSDQIAAAEQEVRARQATLATAEWNLSQKSQVAPLDGQVIDTLYYEGEWVAAGKPVIMLLPPKNVKVRAFVPQTRIGTIHLGDPVQVIVDGTPAPFPARVSFISPQVEFTPPVIYSRESRSKLVFMIEIRFDPAIAGDLHPGQPVDVVLGS
jgi:HlyD family secretion protein